jgi:hypothetical protein
MNPGPRENWLVLRSTLLDVLLTAMGFFFVARAFLRHLTAGRPRPRRSRANKKAGPSARLAATLLPRAHPLVGRLGPIVEVCYLCRRVMYHERNKARMKEARLHTRSTVSNIVKLPLNRASTTAKSWVPKTRPVVETVPKKP